MKRNVEKNIDVIAKKVFARAPVLQETVDLHGAKTLFLYTNELQSVVLAERYVHRRTELVEVIKNRTAEVLGIASAEEIEKTLKMAYSVSTADHHGPICHPFFLNGNILSALPAMQTPEQRSKSIAVLACANVSLNNSSFPRGILFHSANGQMEQVPIVSAQYGMRPVLAHPGYDMEDLLRACRIVQAKIKCRAIDKTTGEKLISVLDQVYGQAIALGAKDYCAQISITNADLWRKFFSSSSVQVPELICLAQEQLVGDLLAKHLLEKKTFVYELFGTIDGWEQVKKYFDGKEGAFNTAARKGTFLFWAITGAEKKRQQVWYQRQRLETVDGSLSVECTVEALVAKMQTGELVPSMLVTFIVLSFYYGLVCRGGFFQPSYLTSLKEAYVTMLNDLGMVEEAAAVQSVETKQMGADMALSFARNKSGKLVQAAGLDLFLYGTNSTAQALLQTSKQLLVKEAIYVMMPLFYGILYSPSEQDSELRQVAESDVMELYRLEEKIKPCVEI
jgi:hypothetical protein